MAVPTRPTDPTPPPSPATGGDWADQAADTVVRVVDTVREKTTGPVLTAARAIVYGIIGVFAALVALIVLVIALVRILDVYLPGEVWSAYLLLGVAFSVGGLLVWRQRHAPETA
jgi:hypothetical protein